MSPRLFAATAAAVITGALALQLGLFIAPRADSFEGWLRSMGYFLGFFSIDANILIAIALWCAAAAPPMRNTTVDGSIAPGNALTRFARPAVMGGLVVSILLVFAAYELLLRRIINPRGWNFVSDLILHDITPALFVAYWWLWAEKRGLKWRHAALWTLLPLSFLGVIAIRAKLGGGYTYPFMNVQKLGLPAVCGNVAGLLVGTWVVGLGVVVAARKQARM